MKAVLSKVPGGPDSLVIEDVAVPIPGKAQVLIRVAAVGINFPDSLMIAGRYQTSPERPFSPGGEISGVIDQVGEGVSHLKPGDRVLAVMIWGGLAEKVVADAWRCVRIPDAMPFDDAAAFMLTFGTSYYALVDRAKIKPGETLLVLGASGGVGLAAVQIGKALGARVIAAASSQDKVDLALAQGADSGIVYDTRLEEGAGQKDLANGFKALCGDSGANVIYDPVGGAYSEPALRSIAWLGRYLIVGFPAGIARIPLNLPLLKGCDLQGVYWGSAMERDHARHAEALGELFELYLAGKVKPMISERFGFEKSGEAITMLTSRQAMGKVIVTFP